MRKLTYKEYKRIAWLDRRIANAKTILAIVFVVMLIIAAAK